MTIHGIKLDHFTTAYLEAALWATTDPDAGDDGENLDARFGFSDFDPDTLRKVVAECEKFQRDNAEWIVDECYPKLTEWSVEQMAGHDFFLNRNGHGCGFWDGDWTRPAADAMDAYCDAAGTWEPYPGDDGKLYA